MGSQHLEVIFLTVFKNTYLHNLVYWQHRNTVYLQNTIYNSAGCISIVVPGAFIVQQPFCKMETGIYCLTLQSRN